MDAAPYLQLATESVNGRQVITVTGEVDLCTSPALHDYLHDAATSTASGESGDLVLDLHAMTFMNSSGLRVVLQADQRACHIGGRLRLAALTAPITRLLTLMRLDTHFDLYPTLTAATAQPASAQPASGPEPAVARAGSSELPVGGPCQPLPPQWPHPSREEDHFAGIGALRSVRSSPA